jgi:hypothetical protein
MRLVRCLLSELDAAGRTYALETQLLLSSDVITADVELGQCPLVDRGIGILATTGISTYSSTHIQREQGSKDDCIQISESLPR